MYNEDQPTVLPAVPRIVVIGDVHGDIGRFMRVMYSLGIVSPLWEWTAEPKNTIVVQLGDQVDGKTRLPGQDPGGADAGAWETLPDVECLRVFDTLDALAKQHGGRVLSLLGNHELMNVMGEFSYVSERSMAACGGAAARAWMFRPGSDLARTVLARRNVALRVGRQLFVHGGILPGHIDAFGGSLYLMNDVARRFLRGQDMPQEDMGRAQTVLFGDMGVMWSRAYMAMAQADQDALGRVVGEVCEKAGAQAVFTGHNTVPEILPAAGGRVWFVDAGFSRAYGNQGVVRVLEILDDGASFRTIQVQA